MYYPETELLMCGIAGIALLNDRVLHLGLEEQLSAMASCMFHRGPDDGGVYLDPMARVALANRRLAIRDLSPAGHMPMANHDCTIHITYNGEIYNADELRSELESRGHVFRSSSDSEVVLQGYAQWGERVVERLRGMFAFAVWDRRPGPEGGKLLLARDRLGVKPLYYAYSDCAFLFASELKALLASQLVSREVSSAGLLGYLMFGSVPSPLTIYRDVRALEPGCRLTVVPNTGEARSQRYWSLPADPQHEAVPGGTYGQAVEKVRCLLEEAVRIRLVSEMPLGAFLSGGLDSSAVVALMRKATAGTIRTCSIVFEEAGFSEGSYARAVAEAMGAEHYERVITASDLSAELEAIFRGMDQPTVDGVNTYFVSQTGRQAGMTVALSGLGGDELFGGYPNTFAGTPQLLRALQQIAAVPGGATVARSALTLLPNRRRWAKIKDALARQPTAASAYLARRGLFSPSEVKALVTPEVWEEGMRFDPVAYIQARAGEPTNASPSSLFSWVSRAELTTYTANQLLRDTDVMSMQHSLEVRVPLLDHQLVEAILELPAEIKTRGTGPKPLLMAAVGHSLPRSVRERRDKHGFTFPFDSWLKGPLREGLEAVQEKQGPLSRMLRQEAILDVRQAYLSGRLHWSRAWAVAALDNWQRHALSAH